MVQVYKKGQGRYTRIITLVSVLGITVIAAMAMSTFLEGYTLQPFVRFGIPTLAVVVIGLFMLWLLNRPKTADFLIATEGEMKKVSWSSKKEIIGSTKVVIVTTLILALILFGVDMTFRLIFNEMGITK